MYSTSTCITIVLACWLVITTEGTWSGSSTPPLLHPISRMLSSSWQVLILGSTVLLHCACISHGFVPPQRVVYKHASVARREPGTFGRRRRMLPASRSDVADSDSQSDECSGVDKLGVGIDLIDPSFNPPSFLRTVVDPATARTMLIVVAGLYGTNFGCVKLLEQTLPPSLTAALRFVMATSVLLPLAVATRPNKNLIMPLLAGAETGLWCAVAYGAQVICCV